MSMSHAESVDRFRADRPSTVQYKEAMQFEQYVVGARQRLFRFAVVLCGDTVLAGDLVTDVLGRAFERWDRIGAVDDVHAYVRRMLVNEFVSWKRRRDRTAPYPEIADLADHRASPGPDHGAAHAERDAMITALDGLKPRHRAAIVLRFYEDLSDEDIAAVLGCRVGTVRSSISRGLAALRVTLNTADSPAAHPVKPASAEGTS